MLLFILTLLEPTFPKLTRKLIRHIRTWGHYWKQYGTESYKFSFDRALEARLYSIAQAYIDKMKDLVGDEDPEVVCAENKLYALQLPPKTAWRTTANELPTTPGNQQWVSVLGLTLDNGLFKFNDLRLETYNYWPSSNEWWGERGVKCALPPKYWMYPEPAPEEVK